MSASGKTLLVVCGGAEAVPGIERVKRMGARVVVSDRDPEAPGFAVADEHFLASTYDAEETLRRARTLHAERPIHGVLSISADVPGTVARVAEALALPGPSAETARLACDKLAMKERFLERGVPIPWFAPLPSPDRLAKLLAERGMLVIKPVDGRGARGVLQLTPDMDPVRAFETSLAQSPSGRLMVEEFLPGPQISTESVIQSGRAFTLGCSDRNYERIEELAPYMIEDGGCQPTGFLHALLPAIDRLALRAAGAIGLEHGTLKGDVVLHPERGPVLIEVAPRLSGGWFCTDQIPLSTGVDLVGTAARIALGEIVPAEELRPRHWLPVAVRYFFPPRGELVAVRGIEEARREPWVHRLVTFVRPGDRIGPITDHTRRAGLVITRGATRAQAVARAEQIVRRIRFEIR